MAEVLADAALAFDKWAASELYEVHDDHYDTVDSDGCFECAKAGFLAGYQIGFADGSLEVAERSENAADDEVAERERDAYNEGFADARESERRRR